MFVSSRIIVTGLTLKISSQFPKLTRREVSIHVIQSREHILNTVCHVRVE